MEKGIIQVKDKKVLEGLMTKVFDPKLIEIINYVIDNYGLVITESYRVPKSANDLHGSNPVRAVDLRSWCYPKGVAEKIRDEINKIWIYDPNRLNMTTAMIHDVGQGVHFHIQVHPNTIRKG